MLGKDIKMDAPVEFSGSVYLGCEQQDIPTDATMIKNKKIRNICAEEVILILSD